MKNRSLCLWLAIAVLTTGFASAQCGTGSLTTLFAANNNGATGWGMFFDVSVTNAAGINICGFDINTGTAVGTAFTIDAYVTPNSYLPVHGLATAWRSAGTASGTAAALDTPSSTTLATPIYLAPGNYGIALYHFGVAPHYTDGNGPNQSYSNPDLAMTLGLSRSALFAGSVFTPRVWNGTARYETCSFTSGAGFGFFDAGCAGTMPISNLTAGSLPQLGGVFSVTMTNLPLSTAGLVVGLSSTASVFGALPLDLTGFGAPGCFLHVSPDLLFDVPGSGSSATFTIGLPFDPGLQCLVFYMQAVIPDPSANALGFVLSDAAAGIIGL